MASQALPSSVNRSNIGHPAKEIASENNSLNALKAIPQKKITNWRVLQVILSVLAISSALFLLLAGVNYYMTQTLLLSTGLLGAIAVISVASTAAVLLLDSVIRKLFNHIKEMEQNESRNPVIVKKDVKEQKKTVKEQKPISSPVQNASTVPSSVQKPPVVNQEKTIKPTASSSGELTATKTTIPPQAAALSGTNNSVKPPQPAPDYEQLFARAKSPEEMRVAVAGLKKDQPGCGFILTSNEKLSAMAHFSSFMAEMINEDETSTQDSRARAIGKLLSEMTKEEANSFLSHLQTEKFSAEILRHISKDKPDSVEAVLSLLAGRGALIFALPELGDLDYFENNDRAIAFFAQYPETMAAYLGESRADDGKKVKTIVRFLLQMKKEKAAAFLKNIPSKLVTLNLLTEIPESNRETFVALVDQLKGEKSYSQFVVDVEESSFPLLLPHLDCIAELVSHDNSDVRPQALSRLWNVVNTLKLRHALLKSFLTHHNGSLPVPITFLADLKPDDVMIDTVLKSIADWVTTQHQHFWSYINSMTDDKELRALASHPIKVASLIKGTSLGEERAAKTKAIVKLMVQISESDRTSFLQTFKDDTKLMLDLFILIPRGASNQTIIDLLQARLSRLPLEELFAMANPKLDSLRDKQYEVLASFLQSLMNGLKGQQRAPDLSDYKYKTLHEIRERWGMMSPSNQRFFSGTMKEKIKLFADWYNSVCDKQRKIIDSFLQQHAESMTAGMAMFLAKFPESLALIRAEKRKAGGDLQDEIIKCLTNGNRDAHEDALFAIEALK